MEKSDKTSRLAELKELVISLSDRDISIKNALKEIEKIVNDCQCRHDGSECQIKEIIANVKWTEHKMDGTNIPNL